MNASISQVPCKGNTKNGPLKEKNGMSDLHQTLKDYRGLKVMVIKNSD